MLLDTLKQRYKQARFIFPETSFLANTKIAESYDFELICVPKPSFENFFLSKSQIDALYEKSHTQNIFYFTSVGNPTGEKIDGENIYEIIQHIVSKDDKAIIILDNVYV